MVSRGGMGDVFEVDVLGLGAVAVDDLIYVAAYPQPDEKAPVLGRSRHIGGLTATALVTAARLGLRAAYAGVLGDDALSRAAIDGLTREQVDLTYLVTQAGAQPIHSTIVVSREQFTRNIFFDANGVVGAHPLLPPAALIQRSRVLLVDNFGIEGMLRAARVARDAGVPIVADFENNDSPYFGELLALVDHLILSCGFATRLTHAPDAAGAVRALWNASRKAVVVTDGAKGVWYTAEGLGQAVVYQPAFPVHAIDSTGCGDVFHGAYAACLARKLGITDRIRIAAAAAAIKATQPGGQMGIPDWLRVEAFLRQQEMSAARLDTG